MISNPFQRLKFAGLVICLAFLITSCEQETPVPYTPVDFTVSIYSNNLVHVGNYEYFSGGIRGIVVYRLDLTTFYAYDRACPYDWEYGSYVEVDSVDNITLIDYDCGSTFNILNGYPMNGKATQPLRSYNAVMVDNVNLRVYN